MSQREPFSELAPLHLSLSSFYHHCFCLMIFLSLPLHSLSTSLSLPGVPGQAQMRGGGRQPQGCEMGLHPLPRFLTGVEGGLPADSSRKAPDSQGSQFQTARRGLPKVKETLNPRSPCFPAMGCKGTAMQFTGLGDAPHLQNLKRQLPATYLLVLLGRV